MRKPYRTIDDVLQSLWAAAAPPAEAALDRVLRSTKLEDSIYDLVKLCVGVLSDEPLFFLLNSYTTGLSPSVMAYILRETVGEKFGGSVTADEIGLPVEASGGILPCGSTAIWTGH